MTKGWRMATPRAHQKEGRGIMTREGNAPLGTRRLSPISLHPSKRGEVRHAALLPGLYGAQSCEIDHAHGRLLQRTGNHRIGPVEAAELLFAEFPADCLHGAGRKPA